VDDDEWEPDLDFYVELYDPSTQKNERFSGDDTRCKVTILDEDFPGVLGFKDTDIRVSKNQENADITIIRSEGADGKISCMIRTEALHNNLNTGAVEFEDYLPKHEKVTFGHGENQKTI